MFYGWDYLSEPGESCVVGRLICSAGVRRSLRDDRRRLRPAFNTNLLDDALRGHRAYLKSDITPVPTRATNGLMHHISGT
jgi:hypothetical protein